MFSTPICYSRKCNHFAGVKEIGGEGEIFQRIVCKAFPKGISDEILSGDNLHDKPLKGQKNKIVYERKE